MAAAPDSFGARSTLSVGHESYEIVRLDALQSQYDVFRLPYTLRILLENVLRAEADGKAGVDEVEAVARWDARAEPTSEISFTPARVLLQDFTGVPAVVDLAAMRDAMRNLGGDPARINPLLPAELVIDHSVQVDAFASRAALPKNVEQDYGRNGERYAFLRWGQQAFDNFKVVPPNTGIVHQVNLEYLARVVESRDGRAFPDTLVGTDSHTTMVNGLGVLGWGVGGIEAEAAMLGEAISMLVPQVVGFRFTGRLREGATATDLVLTVTQILRSAGVVGKFVEYFGRGLAGLPLADRATIGNMSPEYGATCGFFPVDEATLDYLRMTGRPPERIALVEAYCKEQGLFHDPEDEPTYSQVLELDLGDVEPSLAGPRRPQDRVPLSEAKPSFLAQLESFGVECEGSDEALADTFPASDPTAEQAPGGGEPRAAPSPIAVAEPQRHRVPVRGTDYEVEHGSVVIAAITSCTNTSNPQVMVGAGLTHYLEELGFHTVGYGCTTCIGNSGPLPEPISEAVGEGDLVVCAVLSGNRNFEARIHSEVKANYLTSPPLVVAYAIAGRMDIDLLNEPLDGDVYLRDIWPSPHEVQEVITQSVRGEMFERTYADVFTGDENWNALPEPEGHLFPWDSASTYVRRAPYFDGMEPEPTPGGDILDARCLVLVGDSVTTDHISPAGAIRPDGPAGQYLIEHGVERRDFNSYGSRRGNHEIMVRGTFANVRFRNLLAQGSEGTWTVHLPDGEEMTIYDASTRYQAEGVPTIVLAGKEYGTGSSRDWAAKGPNLLGVKAVVAETFERIHRSNLLMMGILPLQFMDGENVASLGLTGREQFDVVGVDNADAREVTVRANAKEFRAHVRLDT